MRATWVCYRDAKIAKSRDYETLLSAAVPLTLNSGRLYCWRIP